MSKKLLGEVEKTLKDVRFNIEQYDEKWQCLLDFNQSQVSAKDSLWSEGRKEQMRGRKHAVRTATLELMDFKHVCDSKAKIESELESLLRKLHRFRSQLIDWSANYSDKDLRNKEELLETKKSIELRYKRGKIFYKMGMSSDDTTNREEQHYQETQSWLNEYIQALAEQEDAFAAEIEDIQGNKKKMKVKQDRVDQLKAMSSLHRMHVGRLEGLLRLIRNKTLDFDAPNLLELRESLEAYVEHNEELSIVVAEDIYAELGLDDIPDADDLSKKADDESEDSIDTDGNETVSFENSSKTAGKIKKLGGIESSNYVPEPSTCVLSSLTVSDASPLASSSASSNKGNACSPILRVSPASMYSHHLVAPVNTSFGRRALSSARMVRPSTSKIQATSGTLIGSMRSRSPLKFLGPTGSSNNTISSYPTSISNSGLSGSIPSGISSYSSIICATKANGNTWGTQPGTDTVGGPNSGLRTIDDDSSNSSQFSTSSALSHLGRTSASRNPVNAGSNSLSSQLSSNAIPFGSNTNSVRTANVLQNNNLVTSRDVQTITSNLSNTFSTACKCISTDVMASSPISSCSADNVSSSLNNVSIVTTVLSSTTVAEHHELEIGDTTQVGSLQHSAYNSVSASSCSSQDPIFPGPPSSSRTVSGSLCSPQLSITSGSSTPSPSAGLSATALLLPTYTCSEKLAPVSVSHSPLIHYGSQGEFNTTSHVSNPPPMFCGVSTSAHYVSQPSATSGFYFGSSLSSAELTSTSSSTSFLFYPSQSDSFQPRTLPVCGMLAANNESDTIVTNVNSSSPTKIAALPANVRRGNGSDVAVARSDKVLTVVDEAASSWTALDKSQLNIVETQKLFIISRLNSGWTFGYVLDSNGQKLSGWFPNRICGSAANRHKRTLSKSNAAAYAQANSKLSSSTSSSSSLDMQPFPLFPISATSSLSTTQTSGTPSSYQVSSNLLLNHSISYSSDQTSAYAAETSIPGATSSATSCGTYNPNAPAFTPPFSFSSISSSSVSSARNVSINYPVDASNLDVSSTVSRSQNHSFNLGFTSQYLCHTSTQPASASSMPVSPPPPPPPPAGEFGRGNLGESYYSRTDSSSYSYVQSQIVKTAASESLVGVSTSCMGIGDSESSSVGFSQHRVLNHAHPFSVLSSSNSSNETSSSVASSLHVVSDDVLVREVFWNWNGQLADPTDTSLLTFQKGEKVEIIVRHTDGWIYGKIKGQNDRQGWFPEYMLSPPEDV